MAEEFTIVAQREVNQVNPATGRVEAYWQVTWTDRLSQVSSNVLVPVAMKDAAMVRAKIQEDLVRIRQINALTE